MDHRPQGARHILSVIFRPGEADMGDKGKKDKGKREHQKKAQLDPKAKRKLKREKKNKPTYGSVR